jgi:EamA-like transporter family
LIGLGLFCTAAALALYAALVVEVGAGRALVVTYLNPLVALALGISILGEHPGTGALAGLALILCGAWFATDGRLPRLVQPRPSRGRPRIQPQHQACDQCSPRPARDIRSNEMTKVVAHLPAHLDDAAAATVLALEQDGPATYNIVDDEPAPVREWLPAAAEALDAPPPRHIPTWLARLVAGDAAVIMSTSARGASNAKAKHDLGWTPRHPSWRQGFAATYTALGLVDRPTPQPVR